MAMWLCGHVAIRWPITHWIIILRLARIPNVLINIPGCCVSDVLIGCYASVVLIVCSYPFIVSEEREKEKEEKGKEKRGRGSSLIPRAPI